MARVTTELAIDAPSDAVWAELARIEHHVHWMADAAELHFVGDQRRGVGTTFECLTQVGPFRTLDTMTVTEWVDGSAMAVRHTGVVTGSGRFEVLPGTGGRTTLRWTEDLRLPRWALGRLGSLVAGPVLARIWRGNLRRFAARVESPA